MDTGRDLRERRGLRIAGACGGRAVVGVASTLALSLAFALSLAAAARPAWSATAVSVTLTTPATATVGQSALSGVVVVRNTSTAPQDVGALSLTSITMVPSCAVTSGGGDCPAADSDPGVFVLSSTASGEVGTACGGAAFSVTVVDNQSGKVQFRGPANGAPITLGAPGSGTETCRIHFTFSALKAPAHPAADATATAGGVATEQLVAVAGVHQDGTGATAAASAVLHVTKSPTTLTAKATAGAAAGGSITDTASLSAAPAPVAAPTGTMTFRLFGPADPTCRAAPVFTAQKAVTAATSYTSAPYSPPTSGSYRFAASYGGDADHQPSMTVCGDPPEVSVVGKAAPKITVTASSPAPLGAAITATATLAGTTAPLAGHMTFHLFGSNDPSCSRPPVYTDTEPVNASGVSTSSGYQPTTAGTYSFVAAFAGDADNTATASPCHAPNSTVTVVAPAATATTAAAAPTTAAAGPAAPASTKESRPPGIIVALAVAALAVATIAVVVSLPRLAALRRT